MLSRTRMIVASWCRGRQPRIKLYIFCMAYGKPACKTRWSSGSSQSASLPSKSCGRLQAGYMTLEAGEDFLEGDFPHGEKQGRRISMLAPQSRRAPRALSMPIFLLWGATVWQIFARRPGAWLTSRQTIFAFCCIAWHRQGLLIQFLSYDGAAVSGASVA